MKDELEKIYNAICSISVSGEADCGRIVGICNVLRMLINDIAEEENERNV